MTAATARTTVKAVTGSSNNGRLPVSGCSSSTQPSGLAQRSHISFMSA